MPTLAVLAHFDPHGLVAPHVSRHLDALVAYADEVLVVSTATLLPEAARELSGRARLIERPNTGYDFTSWKVGLEHLPGWTDADRLLLANDSVVGPLVPYADLAQTMVGRGAQAWGAAVNLEVEPHLQSFALGFERDVVSSPLFAAFWSGLAPVATRREVILRYELGLSRLLRTAGFTLGGYFEPTSRDVAVGRARRTRAAFSAGVAARNLRAAQRGVRTFLLDGQPFNPMIAWWDRATDRRLPFVKLETLRDDPYGQGRDRMLATLEDALPVEMAGVREYLARTTAAYERLRPRVTVGAA
jgi:rhamnosyltransferase